MLSRQTTAANNSFPWLLSAADVGCGAGEGERSCTCVCISGQAPSETVYGRSHYLGINGKGAVGMGNEAEGVQGARMGWRKGGTQKQSLVGDSTWRDPEGQVRIPPLGLEKVK